MKKLISILNSVMILGSSTILTVSCNKLKSLDPENKSQKNNSTKDVKDNEESNDEDDELESIFKNLKKLKKITADIIADGKNTIENLISELEQSDQIKSITKEMKFSIETEAKKDEILKSGSYQFTIILDQTHKVLINCEVVSIDDALAKLDEKTKYEQINTKLEQYLKSYDIEADGELRLIDIKFTILEQLKTIIKPYDIKFENTDFKITSDYFQNDEDIIFLNEDNQTLTITVNLNLTDPSLKAIVKKTNPIFSKDPIKVKETAVSLKVENTKSQIKTKVDQEFNQDDKQVFNVVSDDNDTYEDLLNEIKKRLSRNINSDDIKLDNVKFKDSITLLDKIKINQQLTVTYDLVYNNFFYELDSEKVEEINNNKTFELQIKSIDNLETKVENVITNSSFDKLFFDKTLLKETNDTEVVKKAEDYLYEVSQEIKAMKDKYKFNLIFTRDISEGSFDHKFYNGKAAFKLKLKLKKANDEEFEIKQAFYFKVYDEDEKAEVNTNLSLARTDSSNIINPINSFGIREKIEQILKTDETILKVQANGQNTFEDYINQVKVVLNNNEQVNVQYVVQDVQFINPIYNDQSKGEKIVANNERMLIANNDKSEKYSLSIKLSDKIKNDQIKLNFIDLINVEGLYNLFAVQEYENKKIKTKIKSSIDKIVNNNLTVKAGEDTYQSLVDQLFDQFNDNFKMTNLEVKKDDIIVDLTDEEVLTNKISKLNTVKFKVNFGYTNKYGEHIDKLDFNNIEINNLQGSQSREKMTDELIRQIKEKILILENLDEASFVYEEILTRANWKKTVAQLVKELNEKFTNILRMFEVKDTEYFDFKVSFASDNGDLTEKDIVTTTPVSLVLNVFNKSGNEKVINDLPFKIKIREASEFDKMQEKTNLLKNIFETATLDLTSFSEQKDEYIDNYPTWAKLLADIKNSATLKAAIDQFINKNIETDKFKDIASFIDEFKFEIKSWSKMESGSKDDYVLNQDQQKLIISITSLDQNLPKPITINVSVEILLGQFSEDSYYKAIAKEIYRDLESHFSGKISIKNTDAVKPKDEKDSEDDIVYFDYQILKDKIRDFVKSKIDSILLRKKKQYHLTDEDIKFDIKFDNSLPDNLEHKDDDLVLANDTLNFILSVEVKSLVFNEVGNEASKKFTITIHNNEGYLDAQAGLDKLEQDKLEKLKEVILKLLVENINSSNNEYDLKEQHYNVEDKNLSYEFGKFDTKKYVKEYFQTLLAKIKNELISSETLKNWKINLDNYNILLDFDKKLNVNLNANIFSDPNYVVLTVESEVNNKTSEARIKYMAKNKEEYDKHVKVNELVNDIKNLFKKDPNEYVYPVLLEDFNWSFIVDPENELVDIYKKKLENLKNYLNQIKEILKGNNVTIDFEVNCNGAIYDLKESVSDRKYKVNLPKLNGDSNDIKILLNIKINDYLFEKQETIISSQTKLEDWQNFLIWYFNNNRAERDIKEFDDIADAMSCKALDSFVNSIEQIFSRIVRRFKTNDWFDSSVMVLIRLIYVRMSETKMSKKDYGEIHALIILCDIDVFFNRERELSDLFNYFPALKNGEFNIIQKNPADPMNPFIYKYTPYDCFNMKTFLNANSGKIEKGDITISFETTVNGKSFKYEKALDVGDITFEDLEKCAYIPFLLLWEISNNWNWNFS